MTLDLCVDKDNIKIDPKYTGYDDLAWIHVASNRACGRLL
jgi:hypothetical protein